MKYKIFLLIGLYLLMSLVSDAHNNRYHKAKDLKTLKHHEQLPPNASIAADPRVLAAVKKSQLQRKRLEILLNEASAYMGKTYQTHNSF